MPIDAAKALAAEPRTGEIAWGHKDVQLYHLGLGAGANPDKDEPRDRPGRAALHPGVPAARPAELRHRRGRGLTRA